MAKQANRTMIGIFVVAAVLLLAASLVVFGSGKFFRKTVSCVLYFDESVRGLNVGAPVLFRGVQIGSVTEVALQVDPAKLETQIPIVIEFEPMKFQLQEKDRQLTRDPRKNLSLLIERGLRAQLTMQSFITGQLLIEIDFHPGTPVVFKSRNRDRIEIPTIPSTTARIARTFDKLDLEGLQKSLEATLAGIERFVNSPEMTATLKSLQDLLQDTGKLIRRADRQVDPLANEVRGSLKDIGKLARNADAKLGSMESGMDRTLASARSVLAADAPLMVELETTLKELAAMSRSLRLLADQLEQQPESLVRGKKSPGGK